PLEDFVHRTLRFSLAALIVAAAVYFGSSLVFNDSRTEAGPPQHWITVDAAELAHIRSLGDGQNDAAKLEIVGSKNGIAIVKADEIQMQSLSNDMHSSFHKCSGFIRHSSYEEAVQTIDSFASVSPDSVVVEYTINNSAAVTPMIAAAQEPPIRQTITELSAIHTRFHTQQGGIDGANLILSKWRTLALGRSDMSVMPYAHLNANGDFITQQPSIVLTVQGTEFPNEIVVVGGHQDSTVGSGNPTGRAPGADDDASGIGSMTEVIRVIKETGFRPKRTIQFMAYAAEEVGLVGSKNIADTYFAQNRNVVGVMQLDMTNYSGDWADIVMMTDFTNAAQNQFIKNLATQYLPALVVKDDACGYGCSDHASWHARGYPASMPFEAKFSNTGSTRQYNTALHTINDTLERSNNNANHALKFSKLAIAFVGELAKGSVTTVAPAATRFDFDGDRKADLGIFRPADSVWHINGSTAGYSANRFGLSSDKIVPADYDGDGKTDIAVYRDGVWHMLRSNGGYTTVSWGIAEDIPQAADFDGDGKADPAVFRPSTGTWYVAKSTGGNSIFQFGINGDKPLASDFDGDGKTDAAVYRGGVWHVLGSTAGYTTFQFGNASDLPLTGDFDGDGKADAAVYREGIWHVLRSTGGYISYQWGIANDVPAAADYDGDGKADAAVYRNGVWYVLNSGNGSARIEQFGVTGDIPSPAAFLQ
ncbi:MAG: M20/M25/M40 family metallo-hydrolase, partial [Pyrinomonadaceae bacterium]|nr:M20/M25/M40 family metallo-hydrolase [Pyrinomonadaceae bacterium]